MLKHHESDPIAGELCKELVSDMSRALDARQTAVDWGVAKAVADTNHKNLIRGDNMDSTVTNSTAESGNEQGSAKRGRKLYGGIAALGLVVVAAAVVAPRLSHEAPRPSQRSSQSRIGIAGSGEQRLIC